MTLILIGIAFVLGGAYGLLNPDLTWGTQADNVLLAVMLLFTGIILVAIGEAKGQIVNALAKGSAPQGAHQQRWNSAPTKVEESFRHYHRGGINTAAGAPYLANNCEFAKIGDGFCCLKRDHGLSWGDSWGTKEANSRRYR